MISEKKRGRPAGNTAKKSGAGKSVKKGRSGSSAKKDTANSQSAAKKALNKQKC